MICVEVDDESINQPRRGRSPLYFHVITSIIKVKVKFSLCFNRAPRHEDRNGEVEV
jgi:hypothetical protein